MSVAGARRRLRGLVRYARTWRAYAQLADEGALRLRDAYPCLDDWTAHTPFDAHYFYQGVWAARAVLARDPAVHLDVGSHVPWVGTLSVSTHIIFFDIRPAGTKLPSLTEVCADGLKLPVADRTVGSLSCLHVAEHVGLGRYGDAIDPRGTERMCDELQRVVAPGGQLLFSVPVGRERVCFNAHRVHQPRTVLGLFPALSLAEFSFVDDGGRLRADVDVSVAVGADYGCGLFRFIRT